MTSLPRENRVKAQKIMKDLSNKEMKWNAAIDKLKAELIKLEQEKNILENENLELRNLADQSDDDDIPDSGFRSQQIR